MADPGQGRNPRGEYPGRQGGKRPPDGRSPGRRDTGPRPRGLLESGRSEAGLAAGDWRNETEQHIFDADVVPEESS